jgi:hypothetical protein
MAGWAEGFWEAEAAVFVVSVMELASKESSRILLHWKGWRST